MNGARLASRAFAALLICSTSSVWAQTVVGDDQMDSSVQVDWSVIDRLGPAPSLPDMLKKPQPAKAVESRAAKAANQAERNVVFHRLANDRPGAPEQPRKTADAAPPPPEAAKPAAHSAPTIDPARVKVSRSDAPPPIAIAPPPAPAAAPVGAGAAKPAIPTLTPVSAAKEPPPPAIIADVPVPAKAPPKIAAAPAPVAAPPVAAPPPPAPVAAPPQAAEPSQQQVAALSPPAATEAHPPSGTAAADGIIRKNDILTILFQPDDNQLPGGAQAALTQLAQRLSRDDSLSLQLLAYAEGDASNISKARRLSLSRALTVRKVLMDLGVRSTRIEVRALGNKRDGTDPIDRVDAMIAAH